MRKVEQIQIYKSSFLANDFIDNFFKTAKESIRSTYPFYAKDSFFSLTVDKCPPNSTMSFFTQFSINRLSKQPPISQPYGSSSVIDGQLQVFGPNFDSIISSVNHSALNDFAYAVVVHGVFQSAFDGCPYAFDRTLMIAKTDHEFGFSIFNDHIFIRKSRLF